MNPLQFWLLKIWSILQWLIPFAYFLDYQTDGDFDLPVWKARFDEERLLELVNKLKRRIKK